MIKSVNKEADIKVTDMSHAELDQRLMEALEDRQEFFCYGTDCNGGYCSATLK